jgi:hypothetical protein
MLDAITTEEGMLFWQCRGGEKDEWCGVECQAHIDEAEYQEALGAKVPGQGAVIALPQCACGARTFLKADYTLKELWKSTQPVQNEQGIVWAYTLPLRYVRNVRLHQMLYERGMALYPPVLPLAPQALREQPQFAQIADVDVVESLWLGYLLARAYVPALKGEKKGHANVIAEPEYARIGGAH